MAAPRVRVLCGCAPHLRHNATCWTSETASTTLRTTFGSRGPPVQIRPPRPHLQPSQARRCARFVLVRMRRARFRVAREIERAEGPRGTADGPRLAVPVPTGRATVAVNRTPRSWRVATASSGLTGPPPPGGGVEAGPGRSAHAVLFHGAPGGWDPLRVGHLISPGRRHQYFGLSHVGGWSAIAKCDHRSRSRSHGATVNT